MSSLGQVHCICNLAQPYLNRFTCTCIRIFMPVSRLGPSWAFLSRLFHRLALFGQDCRLILTNVGVAPQRNVSHK